VRTPACFSTASAVAEGGFQTSDRGESDDRVKEMQKNREPPGHLATLYVHREELQKKSMWANELEAQLNLIVNQFAWRDARD
jgi:hypothetical protein